MGFLLLDNGDIGATKQITISLWFRVPAATMAAVHTAHQALQDAYDNDETGTVRAPPANSGMIPLVTFGKRNVELHELDYWNHPEDDPYTHPVEIGFSHQYATYNWFCPDCEWVRADDVGGAPLIEVEHDNPFFAGDYADNSLIGINCRGPSPVFDFRLQFDWDDGPPSIQGVPIETAWSQSPDPIDNYFWFSTSNVCATEPFCGPSNLETVDVFGDTYYWEGHQFEYMVTQTFSERPYVNWAKTPEFFAGFPDGSDDGGQTISGDRWHHALFSIDIDHEINTQGTQTTPELLFNPTAFAGQVNSTARCMLAFDDANKTGNKLSRCTSSTYGTLGDGLNDLVTNQAWETFQNYTINNYVTTNTTGTGGGGVRNDTFVGRNRPSFVWTPPSFSLSPIGIPGDSDTVHLVELAQLQVFIGVLADTSDLAIRRLFVGPDGKPVAMGTAYGVLGATPVVAIKGSNNWIAGVSSGTGGALEPTGTIVEYNPGPSLR